MTLYVLEQRLAADEVATAYKDCGILFMFGCPCIDRTFDEACTIIFMNAPKLGNLVCSPIICNHRIKYTGDGVSIKMVQKLFHSMQG